MSARLLAQSSNVITSSSASDTVIHTNSNKIQLLNAEKSKKNLTEAVSFIKGTTVQNLGGTNRFNSLAGRIPGFLSLQTDGQPGWENSILSIRGRNSLGDGYNSPVILLDGQLVTDPSMIDPYDIESISILKDAVATSLYGLRSGSGVILINTKRGNRESLRVNFNSQTSFSTHNYPTLLGSDTYSELYNEALINDGGVALYTPTDIEAYRIGIDSFPNNDYFGEFFKSNSVQTRNNLNLSGGDGDKQYFFSLGYLKNFGQLNTNESENTYTTNNDIDAINLHANLCVNVSKRLTVTADIKAKQEKRIQPGGFDPEGIAPLISNILATPPNAYPIFIGNSLGGTVDYRDNIYGQINNSGYSIWKRYLLAGMLNFKYDFDYLKGLSFFGTGSYSNVADHIVGRSKEFAVYERVNGVIDQIGDDTQLSNNSNVDNVLRNYNLELGISFNKVFESSTINSMVMVERRMQENTSVLRIPHWNEGLRGRFDYTFDNTYLATIAFSYQGSEQYPKGNRFGFFPAVGLAYVISNASFLSGVDFVDFLKIRASIGVTGNEFNSFNSPLYFNYLDRYVSGGNINFGTNANTSAPRFREEATANPLITWTQTKKYDIGIDANLVSDKLVISADYFQEHTENIMVGGTPGVIGQNILLPDGIVENKGVEGTLTYQMNISEDFNFFISGNATYVRNKIIAQNEQPREYPWQVQTGQEIDARFGYTFDRFFTENDDLSSLPDQSGLGGVMPGSLKYVDLNGDNIIDERDQGYLDDGGFPNLWYGFSAGIKLKSFDFNIHFTGVSKVTVRYSGNYAYALNSGKGNVNDWHMQRWQPGDGQSATYPGLSIINFDNNRVDSDFWMENGSFLRLQSLEIGYFLPKTMMNKIGVEQLRVFASGFNLMTWSTIEAFDPAGNSDGSSFPISPMYTFGLNLSF